MPAWGGEDFGPVPLGETWEEDKEEITSKKTGQRKHFQEEFSAIAKIQVWLEGTNYRLPQTHSP